MICLYNDENSSPPFDVVSRDHVIFSSRGKKYVIVNDMFSFVDDSWRRIPLYLGEVISRKEGITWVSPSTHAEGLEKLKEMKSSWINKMVSWSGDLYAG